MSKKFNGEKFTALLFNTEANGWAEAYGYLGSFYQSYGSARFEVMFCVSQWPEKYTHWAIERIVLEDGGVVQSPRSVVISHSKDAPIWSLADEPDAVALLAGKPAGGEHVRE